MCRDDRGRPAHRGSAQGCRGRTWGGGIACPGGGPLAQGVKGVAEAVTVKGGKPGFGGAKPGFGDDRGRVGGIHTTRVARGVGWGSEAGLRLACPQRNVRRNTLFLAGLDPRQVGALPRRPRRHIGCAFTRNVPSRSAPARSAGLPVEAPPGRCRSAQARRQGAIRLRIGSAQAAPDRRVGANAPARGGCRARPDLTGVKSGEGRRLLSRQEGN